MLSGVARVCHAGRSSTLPSPSPHTHPSNILKQKVKTTYREKPRGKNTEKKPRQKKNKLFFFIAVDQKCRPPKSATRERPLPSSSPIYASGHSFLLFPNIRLQLRFSVFYREFICNRIQTSVRKWQNHYLIQSCYF